MSKVKEPQDTEKTKLKTIKLQNGYMEIVNFHDETIIRTYRTSTSNGNFPIDTMIDEVKFNNTTLKVVVKG